MTKEQKYFVKGMHCASCEIIIEKKLLAMPNIKSVEASSQKEEVLIEYEQDLPDLRNLNKLFQADGYVFADNPPAKKSSTAYNFVTTAGLALLIIAGFLLLNRTGLQQLVNVNSASSLPTFFLLGILAGLSTCAALVGGLVLSMSKQWAQIYADKKSFWQKTQPHLMFNAGRLASYAILGGVLGAIGSRLQLSLSFMAVLVLMVSIMMLILALQMLGVKSLQKFQITMPKFITRYAANEKHFQGKFMPCLIGALTFFLPCGFTITAQGLALISGGFLQGSLIMLAFALGTLPILLSIGFSSLKLIHNKGLSERFLRGAGIVVLFFALFNINSQLNVLGLSSFNNFLPRAAQSTNETPSQDQDIELELPPLINGKQVIKMEASSFGYSPSYLKIRAGVPVRWEITDTGTSGCTNAIISRSLFDGQIDLTPGKTSVKEFTVQKPGKYKFSCWMGMVSGTMEVVDPNRSASSSNSKLTNSLSNSNASIPSGAQGCGGCGGSGCSVRN